MKKLFLIILFSLVFLSGVNISAASNFSAKLQERLQTAVVLHIGQSKAYVNNRETLVDSTNQNVYPLIKDGRTLVPVRFVSENLGAKVDWNDSLKVVEVKMNGKNVKLLIGSKKIYVNSTEKEIDVSAQIINERTFIPLRALVEALGKKVFWDNRGLIVISDKENIFDSISEKGLVDEIVRVFKDNSNIFNLDTVKVGDNIAGLEVTYYEAEAGGHIVKFKGQKTISGIYSYEESNVDYGNKIVWFVPDEESERKLPLTQFQKEYYEDIYILISGEDVLKFGNNIQKGTATITIYDYMYSDGMEELNNARILSVLENNRKEDKSNALIGSWHASPSVGSGHQERYIFYSNKKFVFFTNQYDEYREYKALAGSWDVKNKTLYLTINEKYNMDNIKKTVSEKREFNISDIEKESPDNSPYEYKIDIGNLTFWKYSDTTAYFKDEIESLNKTEENNAEANKSLCNEDFNIIYNGITINSSIDISEIIEELGYGEDYEANNNGFISTDNGYRRWQLCYPSTDDPELRLVFLSNLLNEDDTYLVFADLKRIPTKKGLSVGDSIDKMLDLYGEPNKVREKVYKTFEYIMGTKSLELLIDKQTNKVSHILINYNTERADKDQGIYESEEDKNIKASIDIVKKEHDAEEMGNDIYNTDWGLVTISYEGKDEKGRYIIALRDPETTVINEWDYVNIYTMRIEDIESR